jgi:sodium-dependent dicarboxylate transporter 2/3/5
MKDRPEVRWIRIAVSAVLAAIALFLPLGMDAQAHVLLVITAFTAVMWFSEALPLHVTAFLSTILLILAGASTPVSAFSNYFSPTVVLFFGGFVIARAMEKHGLDRQIAIFLSSRAGTNPSLFLLGLMAVTAFISLWISNTATALMMMPIALFALTKTGLKKRASSYAKSAVLGVAFASSIGGIGTLVGTPPNGITVANLAKEGITVTFLDWLWYGMPYVIILVPLAWLILGAVFPPEVKVLEIRRGKSRWTGAQKRVLAVLAVTILCWVTSIVHGIHDSVVAMGAVVALYALGLLESNDVSKIGWPVLLLFGGGLALGAAIDSSGLGGYLGGLLGSLVAGQSVFVLYLAVIAFAVLMTLTASNTATAALLIPIVMPLASSLGTGVKQLTVLAGIGTSLDFIIPVGTPPSAIAYSSGYISMGDIVKAGVVLTVVAALLLTFLAWLYW